ncbi:ABC transporter permease [Neobacillus bataviensis LMG 21833]|uniref:ABC transporter permease n=1 Tax=Neobacillus bataviensis LMG 21833 TaxID=1117379 RepID=K6DX29_9BACI|nr:ABC transporter permease subunit [Neobacillus bataviensis]EKN65416.1 ABC transporter permease [Neobacillus bataviensis LMG 21833]
MRILQQTIIIFLLIVFISAIPVIMVVNPVEQKLYWDFSNLGHLYVDFIKELGNGGLGTYTLGDQERSISDDIGSYFITSLELLFFGVLIAVFVSLLFGIFLSRFKLTRLINILLNILSTIPDFILIIFSLVLAIMVYQITGFRIISFRQDAGVLNIWFPMLLVGISPTLYMFKLVTVKYYQLSGEDYIRTAVSKGLRVNYINFQHIYKNIEPFMIAELTKIVSLAIGNLFIIEYLLNVSGITKFIFQSYQFQPVTIGLFSMLLISLIVYISIRLILYIFKRGFIYE